MLYYIILYYILNPIRDFKDAVRYTRNIIP